MHPSSRAIFSTEDFQRDVINLSHPPLYLSNRYNYFADEKMIKYDNDANVQFDNNEILHY
jgi:hypothetical protein